MRTLHDSSRTRRQPRLQPPPATVRRKDCQKASAPPTHRKTGAAGDVLAAAALAAGIWAAYLPLIAVACLWILRSSGAWVRQCTAVLGAGTRP